jgi:tetratricopeptide (TPR) repeat protein
MALLVASHAPTAQAAPEPKDAGAGRIGETPGPCLRNQRSAPCPEPQVADKADDAARMANRLARARYFIDMQQLEKALAEIDLALVIDPDNLPARHLAGRLALTLGDIERAERELLLARKQAPDDPDVQATYAVFLQSRSAGLESLRELQDILTKHPDHLFAREQRALLLMNFRQYEAALADLNVIIESRPSVPALVRRAKAFLGLRRAQSAVADYSAALALAPGNQLLRVARADAYVEAGLDELALRDYDVVLTMDRGTPLYVMMDNDRAKLLAKRASAFVHLRRFDDAAADMITAITLGGQPAVLRAQILLRRSGFSEVPLDGKDSPALRKALSACFGLNVCFQGIMRAI